MSYTSNGTKSSLSVEVGYGRDAAWSVDPDAEIPEPGPYAEASASASIPGTTVGGRTTVTVDQRGVRMDNTYNSRNTRTGTSVGPDGVETPDSRLGGSIPGGTRYGPVGAHVSVGYTVDDPFGAPSKPAGEYDSDLDGFKDGDMAESPEVGGRWGQNPAHTAPAPGDVDADGTPDASDITIGKDSDEDTVPDDMDQKPGEVDKDIDSDGVADQVDNDVAAPEAAPTDTASLPRRRQDGLSDGDMAESPEVGGRWGQNPAHTGPSAGDVDADGTPDASDNTIGKDSDEDTVPDDMDQKPGEVDKDIDSDGVADQVDNNVEAPAAAPSSDSGGSMADSPEIGGGSRDAGSAGAESPGSMANSPEIGGGSRDTDPSDSDVDTDSAGGGFDSPGSMANSPEIGGGSRDSDPSDSGSDGGGGDSGSSGGGSGSVVVRRQRRVELRRSSSSGGGSSSSGSGSGRPSGASSSGDVDGDGRSDATDAESTAAGRAASSHVHRERASRGALANPRALQPRLVSCSPG